MADICFEYWKYISNSHDPDPRLTLIADPSCMDGLMPVICEYRDVLTKNRPDLFDQILLAQNITHVENLTIDKLATIIEEGSQVDEFFNLTTAYFLSDIYQDAYETFLSDKTFEEAKNLTLDIPIDKTSFGQGLDQILNDMIDEYFGDYE